MSGAGIFQALSSFAIAIASSFPNPPEIWAFPSQIFSRMFAWVASAPPTKIAILFPTLF